MITEIKTAADVKQLPSYLQNALRSVPAAANPHGLRFRANINKAERKIAIQTAVVRAVTENLISLDLGVEMLKVNDAYGPKGKAALRAAGL